MSTRPEDSLCRRRRRRVVAVGMAAAAPVTYTTFVVTDVSLGGRFFP